MDDPHDSGARKGAIPHQLQHEQQQLRQGRSSPVRSTTYDDRFYNGPGQPSAQSRGYQPSWNSTSQSHHSQRELDQFLFFPGFASSRACWTGGSTMQHAQLCAGGGTS